MKSLEKIHRRPERLRELLKTIEVSRSRWMRFSNLGSWQNSATQNKQNFLRIISCFIGNRQRA